MAKPVRKWLSVVGLEIHAQIASKSKLFSGAKMEFMAPPNTLVSWFDAALPGTMPILNKQCVEAGVLTSLALSCEVQKTSFFDRKHYFYADMPAGYQITQQRKPLATSGHVVFPMFDPGLKKQPTKHKVAIKQIQLEQDSGKSLHDDVNQESYIDLNRAGVGLMELVTEPDLSNGADAAAFIRELQLILQRLGTCDGRMEEGSLRVDANVSVNLPGEPPGQRTEIKNLNSVRSVKNAIEYEIKRQIDVLERGEDVVQETRSFNIEHNCTVPMRDKEVVQDYRFMPEPNLPPLILYDDSSIETATEPGQAINIDSLRKSLPVLPEAQRERLIQEYGLTYENSIRLVNEDGLADYFEKMVESRKHEDKKQKVDSMMFELLHRLHKNDLGASESPLTSTDLAELLDLLVSRKISAKSAVKIMDLIFNGDLRSINEVVEEENLGLISDEEEVRILCERILQENQSLVEQYKAGKTNILNALMGCVMKATSGRIDPVLASSTFKTLMEGDSG